jgi:antirestriction protein ArdC
METNKKIYEMVTEEIIKKLENDKIAPWQQSWNEQQLPANFISKKPYNGVNILLLFSEKYTSNYWLTLKQANGLGYQIKKGEKSSICVFWKPMDIETKHPVTQESKIKTIYILRYYRVFNVCQTTIPEEKYQTELHENNNPIPECIKIIEGYQNAPLIENNGLRACYAPLTDTVTIPEIKQFNSSEEYYGTLFHELVHSTGHAKRLNREGIAGLTHFNSARYSTEELTAEIGACFLAGIAGIDLKIKENQIAYINAWIDRLKRDTRLIIKASALAQKAVNYIRGEES